MAIKPLGNRILIKNAEVEETTATGIILTSESKQKPQIAEVVAVGNGEENEPMSIEVGQKIIYPRYSGTDVKMEGKDYIIIRQSDVLAIVD